MESVAVFGAAQTGKSSLLARFLGQAFEEKYEPTIEDYHRYKIYSGETLFHLNIIDTSGSFAFPAMEKLIMEETDAFIFVYSIDKEKSFETVLSGIKRLSEIRDIKSVSIVVVCNKADLDDITALRGLQMNMDNEEFQFGQDKEEREFVSLNNGNESSTKSTLYSQREVVLELGCRFLFTSAKFRWNVNRIFYELLADVKNDKDVVRENSFIRNRKFGNTMKYMWKKVSLGGNHS